MCNVNDIVLYGTEGVCKITEISNNSFSGTNMEYFVLKPVYNEGSTIFLPVNSERTKTKMRRILSAGEIHALIDAMPEESTIWIENEKERKELFKRILDDGDRTEMIKLIKTLYLHQQSLKDKGKKMHAGDERFLKEAEKMLYDEIAHVLSIKREQVLPFILEQIQVEEKEIID